MCRVDSDYNSVFAIVEITVSESGNVPPPELIKIPVQHIENLIRGRTFYSAWIETETSELTIFPTKKLAEDFFDELVNKNRHET